MLECYRALRALLRTPVQTGAMLTCLMVGATTVVIMFSMVNGLTVGALPGVVERQGIVKVVVQRRSSARGLTNFEYGQLPYQMPGLADLGSEFQWSFPIRRGDLSLVVEGSLVSGSFFRVLGTSASVGRLIVEADDEAIAAPVAVIGYYLWRRYFGGRQDVLGEHILIGETPYRVIGVAPEGFVGLRAGRFGQPASDRAQLFLPLRNPPLTLAKLRIALETASAPGPRVIGRIGKDFRRPDVEKALSPVILHSPAGPSRASGVAEIRLVPATLLDEQDSEELWGLQAGLMAVPLAILFLSCVNVAAVQLGRAMARRDEMLVRASLGAGRWRLISVVLIEVILLAIVATAASLVASSQLLRLAAAVLPFRPQYDYGTLLLGVGLPVAITLVSGLVPSWRAAALALSGAGRGDASGVTICMGRWSTFCLLAGQLALSLCLLAIVQVVHGRLRDLSLAVGSPLADVMVLDIEPGSAGADALTSETRTRVSSRLELLSGVQEIAFGESLFSTTHNHVDGYGNQATSFGGGVEHIVPLAARGVSHNFFEVLDLRLVRGRVFAAEEEGVAVVNETFMRRLHQPASILGLHIRVSSTAQNASVIGVVQDAYERAALERDGEPVVYVPISDRSSASRSAYIRVGSAYGMHASVQSAMRDLADDARVVRLGTVEELLDERFRPARQVRELIGGATLCSLFIAAVGLFGSVSHVAAARRRELGLRLALGARRRTIVWLTCARVVYAAVAGIAAGYGLAVVVTSLVQFGSIRQVLSPSVVAVGLSTALIVSIMATLRPILGVISIDPSAAIRHD